MIYSVVAFAIFIAGLYLVSTKKSLEPFLLLLIAFVMLVPRSVYLPGANGVSAQALTILSATFIIFMRAVLLRDRDIRFLLLRKDYIPFIFLLYVGSLSWLLGRTSGIAILIENYLAPFLFLLVLTSNTIECSDKYLKFIVSLGVFISIYALIEFVFRHNFVYYPHLSTLSWFGEYRHLALVFRSSGTIGHPLELGSFLLPLLPLTKSVSHPIISRILIILGVAVTGSRSAIAIASLFLIYDVFKQKNFWYILVCCISIAIVIQFATEIPIISGIVQRFESAEASSQVRYEIFDNSMTLISQSFWGHGLRSSSTMLATITGLDYILENPWISLIVEIGVVGLFLLTLTLIVWMCHIGYSKAQVLPALLLGIMLSGYNSVAVNTNIFLYAIILFYSIHKYEVFHEENSPSTILS